LKKGGNFIGMKIPDEVKNIIIELQKNGFEAYIVGGCVRDLLMGNPPVGGPLAGGPKDWDITTNAKPEEIQKIFSSFAKATEDKPATFYENRFGTVGVKTKIGVVEVTTFRAEAKYTDKRHPDEIKFVDSLEDDLKRRDFTINAMAILLGTTPPPPPLSKGGMKGRVEIIDLFGGQKDLEDRIIRAVGNPDERFNEDALRMLRAVRFACELDFSIEPETFKAIQKNAGWLEAIAKERIKDEFEKIIMSPGPEKGVELLREAGLLKYIIPELELGIGVSQDRHHIYSVYEHNLMSLKFAGQKKYNLIVRLAALLHDIGKPKTKVMRQGIATFYNHEMVSAKMAVRILDRLRFPKEVIERAANLIRYHMFVYDVGVVTAAAIRRLLVKAGPENMEDLIALRVADRLGSGVPKAQPYRLRHFQYMVERVQNDPISVKMLKINGSKIMEILKIQPGPIIGAILDVLLAEVIEEPKKNKEKHLEKRVKELAKLDLPVLRKMAKEKIEEKREEEDKEIKKRYWVK
jgi:poly(A) polymerase/tRNA nucleotidyltransferase (CCA-adding enzyme)